MGYGNYTPETKTGRFIAVRLMIGGIALLGVVTVTLASWIVERGATQDAAIQAEKEAATVGHILAREAKVDEMRELLRASLNR